MVKQTKGVYDLLQQQRESADAQGSSMYGHSGRGAVNQPAPPSRLTKEQRREYEEELEYTHAMQEARDDAAYRRAMHEQYENLPPRRTKATTYEKIKSGARKAYDIGAGVAGVARDIGQNPHIQQMRRQEGFIQRNAQQGTPRHSTSRQHYQGAPVVDSSVMHPGNRIVVMRCSDETGKCKVIATGRSEERPRQPRRRRPGYATGMLGGEDYGL